MGSVTSMQLFLGRECFLSPSDGLSLIFGSSLLVCISWPNLTSSGLSLCCFKVLAILFAQKSPFSLTITVLKIHCKKIHFFSINPSHGLLLPNALKNASHPRIFLELALLDSLLRLEASSQTWGPFNFCYNICRGWSVLMSSEGKRHKLAGPPWAGLWVSSCVLCHAIHSLLIGCPLPLPPHPLDPSCLAPLEILFLKLFPPKGIVIQ